MGLQKKHSNTSYFHQKKILLCSCFLAIGLLIQGCPTRPTPEKNGKPPLKTSKKNVIIPKQRAKKQTAKRAKRHLQQKAWWKQAQNCLKRQKTCSPIGTTSVATWLGARSAALSLTYDDAMPCQYLDIYPVQKRFGFTATFFLYTRELLLKRRTHWGQSIRNWKHWRKIQAEGNEIGSHSISHPHLDKIPFAKAKREVYQSCRTIRQFVPKAKCETIAYPYGDSNRRIRMFTRRHYIAARQAKQGINPPNPPDMMNIKAVIPYGTTTIRNLERRIKRSIKRKGWTVWMFHGTKKQGWEPHSLKRFKRFFGLIKRYQKQLWVGNFGDVAKYIKERQKTRIKITSRTFASIHVQLQNRLDKRYQQALTLKSVVPAGWKEVIIQQGKNKRTIKSTPIKVCRCLRTIQYQATPNQEEITLKPGKAAFQ